MAAPEQSEFAVMVPLVDPLANKQFQNVAHDVISKAEAGEPQINGVEHEEEVVSMEYTLNGVVNESGEPTPNVEEVQNEETKEAAYFEEGVVDDSNKEDVSLASKAEPNNDEDSVSNGHSALGQEAEAQDTEAAELVPEMIQDETAEQPSREEAHTKPDDIEAGITLVDQMGGNDEGIQAPATAEVAGSDPSENQDVADPLLDKKLQDDNLDEELRLTTDNNERTFVNLLETTAAPEEPPIQTELAPTTEDAVLLPHEVDLNSTPVTISGTGVEEAPEAAPFAAELEQEKTNDIHEPSASAAADIPHAASENVAEKPITQQDAEIVAIDKATLDTAVDEEIHSAEPNVVELGAAVAEDPFAESVTAVDACEHIEEAAAQEANSLVTQEIEADVEDHGQVGEMPLSTKLEADADVVEAVETSVAAVPAGNVADNVNEVLEAPTAVVGDRMTESVTATNTAEHNEEAAAQEACNPVTQDEIEVDVEDQGQVGETPVSIKPEEDADVEEAAETESDVADVEEAAETETSVVDVPSENVADNVDEVVEAPAAILEEPSVADTSSEPQSTKLSDTEDVQESGPTVVEDIVEQRDAAIDEDSSHFPVDDVAFAKEDTPFEVFVAPINAVEVPNSDLVPEDDGRDVTAIGLVSEEADAGVNDSAANHFKFTDNVPQEISAVADESLEHPPATETAEAVPVETVAEEGAIEFSNVSEEPSTAAEESVPAEPAIEDVDEPLRESEQITELQQSGEEPLEVSETLLDASEPQVTVDPDELAQAPLDFDVERPRSPWTPSHSSSIVDDGNLTTVDRVEVPEVLENEVIASIETPALNLERNISSPSLVINGVALEQEDTAEPLEVYTIAPQADEERITSPWTTSYSVTNQGSPLISAKDEFEEESSAKPVQPDVSAESITSPTIGAADDSTQMVEETTASIEAAEEMDATEIEVAENEVIADSVSSIPQLVIESSEVESEFRDVADPAERPASPWTPSYSVTNQGSPLISAKDEVNGEPLNQLTELDLSTHEPAQPFEATITLEESPSFVPQLIMEASEHVADSNDEVDAAERIASTWTSSYSVINHGPEQAVAEHEIPAPTVVDIPAIVEHPIDESQDIPQISTSDDNGAADIERPKSPWTPSYSVSRQGSPAPEQQVTKDEAPEQQMSEGIDAADVVGAAAVPTTAIAVPAILEYTLDENPKSPVANTSTDTTNVSEDEPPKSPWTPSYSVSRQSSLIPDPQQVMNKNTEEVATERAAPAEVPSNVEQAADEISGPPAVKTGTDEERPKSPWTPSYSVSRQGSLAPEEHAVKEPVDQNINIDEPIDAIAEPILIPAIIEHPVGEEQAPASTEEQEMEERPKSPWTPSYSVSRQGSPRPSQVALPKEEEPAENPGWTPSYSVSRQGSPLLHTKELVEEPFAGAVDISTGNTNKVSESFQSLEISTTEATKEQSPSPWSPSYSVTMLHGTASNADFASNQAIRDELVPKSQPPTVSGNATPQQSIEAFPNTEPVKAEDLHLSPTDDSTPTRGRYESTTSSRFFPGGWFSSPLTVEGKTSLDMAQGEFFPPTSPTQAVEGKEKKGWCTIM